MAPLCKLANETNGRQMLKWMETKAVNDEIDIANIIIIMKSGRALCSDTVCWIAKADAAIIFHQNGSKEVFFWNCKLEIGYVFRSGNKVMHHIRMVCPTSFDAGFDYKTN